MTPDQTRELHRALAGIIELLFVALDAIAGEPCLETADLPDDECTGDPEPWLGTGGHWTDAGLQYDLEDDPCDRGEPDDDREPEDAI
ncbi:MAG: hypothetical protein ED558_13805 [Oricola sp.]|nr:MAG: hypothetical protein ED558_13805 [Oricola sp.]